jgi:REP element-mobilizing transposase RayT
MSQSLSRILIHIVYSTKQRQPLIKPEIQLELFKYMSCVYREFNSPVLAINGTEDHVHALTAMSKTVTLSKLIEEVKRTSSKWIKTRGERYREFYWQRGYGAFSIARSNVEALKRYIANQQEHHKKQTFKDEFRELLKHYGVEYDERYVWD